MSNIIRTVINFKIEISFEEWLKNFDCKETKKRHSEFNLKPIFRSLISKVGSKKVICIHKAPEGNIQKFVQSDSKWRTSHKIDFSTMEESAWILIA